MNLFKGKIYLIFPVIIGLCSIATTVVFAKKQPLPILAQVQFKKDTISITNFGAKSDGLMLNTNVNKAIAKEGGVVLIPSGLWLTGPIELKRNVNLHLKRNAILQFTDDFKAIKTAFEISK